MFAFFKTEVPAGSVAFNRQSNASPIVQEHQNAALTDSLGRDLDIRMSGPLKGGFVTAAPEFRPAGGVPAGRRTIRASAPEHTNEMKTMPMTQRLPAEHVRSPGSNFRADVAR